MNWSMIVSTAISAAINGLTMFLVIRYSGKIVEHIESKVNGKKKR